VRKDFGNRTRVFGSLALAIGLSLSVVGSTGCARQEASPEADVLLQASGEFALVGGQAMRSVLILRQAQGQLAYEVIENETQAVLLQGTLAARSLQELMAGAKRGPLESEIESSILTVSQPTSLKKPLATILLKPAAAAVGVSNADEAAPGGKPKSGAKTEVQAREPEPDLGGLRKLDLPKNGIVLPIVSRGELVLDVSRFLRYERGLLERGMEGPVALKLINENDARVGGFSGHTVSRAHLKSKGADTEGNQIAIGTKLKGTIRAKLDASQSEGSVSQAQGDVLVSLQIPNGKGKIESLDADRPAMVFDFDATDRATDPLSLTEQTDARIKARNTFIGDLSIHGSDLGSGLFASGSGKIHYWLEITVTPEVATIRGQTLLVEGRLEQKGSEGVRSYDFAGSKLDIHETLAW
jgi:hypothetical protein